MLVCVHVCLFPRLLITSGIIWTLYDWLNKFYSFYTAAVVIIHSGCVIETNPIGINQSCISHYFHFNNRLKQLYTSNKREFLGYKSGCGEHCDWLWETYSHLYLGKLLLFVILSFHICDWLWENPPVTHKYNYLEKHN